MKDTNTFNTKLVEWYDKEQRDLPWRRTKDPYKIWLSEIILQQTRVNQGIAYYLRFIEHFPDLGSLASASQDMILRHWQGLGYYSRARNLHAAAQIIEQEHKGKFPANYKALQQLPGIGKYTAAAIASFAYGEAVPVVDGNVYRFIARLKGIDEPINTSRSYAIFYDLLLPHIKQSIPAVFNQAIMEFGALHCTATNPACASCPFAPDCHACQFEKTSLYPVKKPKQRVKKRYFYYFLISDGTHLYIKRREKQDIWKGLYDFPLHEDEKALSNKQMELLYPPLFFRSTPYAREVSESFQHQLTHQLITARFISLHYKSLPTATDYLSIHKDALKDYAIPRLIEIFCIKNGLC